MAENLDLIFEAKKFLDKLSLESVFIDLKKLYLSQSKSMKPGFQMKP